MPVLEALAAQHGVYTLETVTPQGERAYETIRSIERVLPWTVNARALIEAGADPACKIISFTVTEGGYYLDEHDRLDTANPDLAADLEGGHIDDLRRAGGDSRRAHEKRRGPGHAADLRQPAQQRRAFQAGMREFLERARRGRAGAMVRRQHRVPELDGRSHHAASDA